MYCRYCGKEIADDAKFCPECGKRVDQNATDQKFYLGENVCPVCGGYLSKSEKVCRKCGTSFDDAEKLMVNDENRKTMRILKNCLIALIVLAFIIFVTKYGSKPSKEPEKAAIQVTYPVAEKPTEPKPTKTTEPPVPMFLGTEVEKIYPSGMYKVGVDLPAGEYVFASNSSRVAYYCVSPDANTTEILENQLFFGTSFITVSDGQYLDVTSAVFTAANNIIIPLNEDGSLADGMYRVGIDIPAGEYKLTAAGDTHGYYVVYPDSTSQRKILSNSLFESTAYVSVEDGQYLSLSDCIAYPATPLATEITDHME